MADIKFVPLAGGAVRVKLEGRTVGAIERHDNGWWYVPQGRRDLAGDVFPTLAACKRSVTGEDPPAPIA